MLARIIPVDGHVARPEMSCWTERRRERRRTLGAAAHELETLLCELGGSLEKLVNLVGHGEICLPLVVKVEKSAAPKEQEN